MNFWKCSRNEWTAEYQTTNMVASTCSLLKVDYSYYIFFSCFYFTLQKISHQIFSGSVIQPYIDFPPSCYLIFVSILPHFFFSMPMFLRAKKKIVVFEKWTWFILNFFFILNQFLVYKFAAIIVFYFSSVLFDVLVLSSAFDRRLWSFSV